jgi:hypothetical protein
MIKLPHIVSNVSVKYKLVSSGVKVIVNLGIILEKSFKFVN